MFQELKARDFFDKYVFGFMCADVERELNLARIGEFAGNFLCALGLLSYTEFMGAILKNFKANKPNSRHGTAQRFAAFFDYLGTEYELFQKEHDVYNIFRCGLVHEYFVKQHGCTIYMLADSEPLVIPRGPRGEVLGPSAWRFIEFPLTKGIGIDDGYYYFVVEKYYQDFQAACERLCTQIESKGLTMTNLLPSV